ncbi:CWF19-like protein 2 homolog [Contarinia nasturtii]|uniref:CWF19-like protein 2 homolog n=1 Tax=Contarinia nasturtii TaxID=265458 RepID=UPI0012D3BC5C|nr:CWF19-like protein 2 homolog [Contarinia nasturtii]
MSFIEFESGWEKEKARQELREVRAELLKRAEENAKRRDEKELQKKFRGEDQWILPSVSKKIDEQSTETSSSRKKEKKSKKSKKAKKSSKKNKKEKKKSKKRKYSSSGESDNSSEEEGRISKRKQKRKHFSDASSSSSSDSESDEESWVEKDKHDENHSQHAEEKKVAAPLQRDDWLSGFSSIPTFSKSKEERKKDERKGIDAYEPGKCARELNPYWKDGGDGLPKAFAKPKYESDDDEQDQRRVYQSKPNHRERQSNWKKKTEPSTSTTTQDRAPRREPQRRSSSSSSSSDASRSPSPAPASEPSKPQASRQDFLTDQQMNELGAKLVKAEIMGNDELANELKEKLDRARKYRTEHKSEVMAKSFERRAGGAQKKQDKEDSVVLSTTNSKGMSRPVAKFRDDSDLWGGRAGRKVKKQKVETHADGERVRYFADDDRYDIKQMFESEKFTSAADQDMQFANIAGKHKNPNDDLEDIFADKVRKNISEHDVDKKERDRAIREHQEMERTLNACDKCFDSAKLEKQLIVSLGKNVYLSLPWHEGLTSGHCLIAPLAHVACSTQLEDDVWQEIRELMTALNRMFSSRKQDVIFFETVRYLHRRPHMVIHCVPSNEFEMAPFYFKKAIQESEAEWSTNKQLVSLKDRDVRRAIPKGLPYFWVNFGMDSGFAHVIEDQEQFPNNFAQEIIGGLLNLDARLWRRPRKIHNPIPKVKQFADWWKLFDPTR